MIGGFRYLKEISVPSEDVSREVRVWNNAHVRLSRDEYGYHVIEIWERKLDSCDGAAETWTYSILGRDSYLLGDTGLPWRLE